MADTNAVIHEDGWTYLFNRFEVLLELVAYVPALKDLVHLFAACLHMHPGRALASQLWLLPPKVFQETLRKSNEGSTVFVHLLDY